MPAAPSSDAVAEAAAGFLVASASETRALAARLAPLLSPGDLLCLRGDLGAGKTTLVAGLAEALGVFTPVSSPTFTLVHEYSGARFPLVHIDAYRLSGPFDAQSIGLDEYLGAGENVVMIEWPERIENALPGERVDITLAEDENNENARRVTLVGHGARPAALVRALAAETGLPC